MRFVWFVTAARVANPSLRCKMGCDSLIILKTLAAAVVFSVAALKSVTTEERHAGKRNQKKKIAIGIPSNHN